MAWLRHVAPCIYSLIYTPVGDYSECMEKDSEKKNGKGTEKRKIHLDKNQGRNGDQLKIV